MIPYPQVLSRIPFEDLEALDDFSVRFVYPRPREVPRHWAMLLERSPRLDRLEPDDPDRAQVLGRFEGLRHALYQSFEQGKGSALFTTAGIDHPGRWRDVLVAHYCRPRWLYTNAQRVFSLVVASSGHHRVVELPSLSSLHEFRTLDIRELPDAEQVVDFGHLDAAEAHVLRELSQLRVRALPLRKGERRRTLLLQPAGRPCGLTWLPCPIRWRLPRDPARNRYNPPATRHKAPRVRHRPAPACRRPVRSCACHD